MTAIDQAREYEAATDRIYSSGETKAIMRGLLAEIDRLKKAVREADRDARESARGAASEARWQERQGEEYGSY